MRSAIRFIGRSLDTTGRTCAGRFFAALAVAAVAAIPIFSQGTPQQINARTSRTGPMAITWIDADCRSCHEPDEPLFSHPVEVSPSMLIPAAMPLERGRLACTTCHLDTINDHTQSRKRHDGMLRDGGVPGTAFCIRCHESNSMAKPNSHATAVGTAHLQWKSQMTFSPSKTESAFRNRNALNAETQSCMSCHDGATGPSIGNSHPVGVQYRVRNDRADDSTLTPQSQLDSRIRLFDGQVGCGSCHSPFSKRKKLLVMDNERSELCSSCHDRH